MLDDIDRALVAALARDGRMPFTAIAELLGVSSQTVARRYRRLQDEVGLRVVGQVRPSLAGRAQWLLRVGAEPRVLQRVGVALSRRADSSHVSITSGGSEIVCLTVLAACGVALVVVPLVGAERGLSTGGVATLVAGWS